MAWVQDQLNKYNPVPAISASFSNKKAVHPLEGAIGGVAVGLGKSFYQNQSIRPVKIFAKETLKTAAYYGAIGAIAAMVQDDSKGGFEEAATKGAIVGAAIKGGTAAAVQIYKETKTKSNVLGAAGRVAMKAARKGAEGAIDGAAVGLAGAAVKKVNTQASSVFGGGIF